jgi:RNA-directed DNA polymerase
LPALADLKNAKSLSDTAVLLGFRPSALSYVLYKLAEDAKYHTFEIPKKSGGTRVVRAPVEPLKSIQRALSDLLYACSAEISATRPLRTLSHGFSPARSIVTNAKQHRKRRYVLNLDLQNFFPSFNFGRVRGYFIKNNDFQLNERVATVLAQIACCSDGLPQGSPCSPVISNLIAHVLDIRLVKFARSTKCTYSRYADDITFSTNQKEFPRTLANLEDTDWALSTSLVEEIERSGFTINPDKTRMQCRPNRQLVTGLTVNEKVNVRAEYYRQTRSICHSLFKSGAYFKKSSPERIETSVEIVEGMLSFVRYIKNLSDNRSAPDKKLKRSAWEKLYSKLLFFKHFANPKEPLIVCEGKTDPIYLRIALRKLEAFRSRLLVTSEKGARSTFRFFNDNPSASNLLQIEGGEGPLNFLIKRYQTEILKYSHALMQHPVILLIDNDRGAEEIFSTLNKTFQIDISHSSTELFFHICNNLYLIKTPSLGQKTQTCIEDLFPAEVLKTQIDGKTFNPHKRHKEETEYGKLVFAEKVIRSNADKIDFSQFALIFDRIIAVLDHYKAPAPINITAATKNVTQ